MFMIMYRVKYVKIYSYERMIGVSYQLLRWLIILYFIITKEGEDFIYPLDHGNYCRMKKYTKLIDVSLIMSWSRKWFHDYSFIFSFMIKNLSLRDLHVFWSELLLSFNNFFFLDFLNRTFRISFHYAFIFKS